MSKTTDNPTPFYEDDGLLFYEGEQLFDEDSNQSAAELEERLNKIFTKFNSETVKALKDVMEYLVPSQPEDWEGDEQLKTREKIKFIISKAEANSSPTSTH